MLSNPFWLNKMYVKLIFCNILDAFSMSERVGLTADWSLGSIKSLLEQTCYKNSNFFASYILNPCAAGAQVLSFKVLLKIRCICNRNTASQVLLKLIPKEFRRCEWDPEWMLRACHPHLVSLILSECDCSMTSRICRGTLKKQNKQSN